jgi:phosphoribosylformylglycinamidine synthase
MKEVRTLVMRVDGTNCDEETVIAFKKAGSKVDLAHINEIKRGYKSLEDYQIICLPGGFAHGDHLGAGKIWAVELKYSLSKDVKRFIEEGKLLIGICNGFQVLVKTGLLPGTAGLMKQTATVFYSECGSFQDRWIYMKPVNKGKCGFMKGINDTIYCPINHGEGKFFVEDERIIDKLNENDQIVFKYVDPEGNYTGWPWNPNGSMDNIAGICNPQGNVVGWMPHPEKYIHKWMHPYWTRGNLSEEGDGFKIFKNAVDFVKKKF